MWENLKTKIQAILAANSLLQSIYLYEAKEFGGDPVATLVPSNNESDYRTTTNNARIYAFRLQLWVKRAEPRDDEEAEEVLTDLLDTILDDFDKYYTLGTGSPGDALVLPTGYTMIMLEALPSAWFYSERETLYRGAEIILRVHVDVDVTLISTS